MSVLDKIKSAHDTDHYLKVLIYGTPGCGKTIFCATAPKCLIIDIEGEGTMSLRNHPDLMDSTLVLAKPSMKEINEVIQELKDPNTDLSKSIETVAIDSLTWLQARNLDLIMRRLAQKNDSNRDPNVPSQFEYVQNNNTIRKLMFELNDLPKNIIFTAHMLEKKDESSGIIVIRPDNSDKVVGTAYGLVSVMGYMTAVTDKDDSVVRALQVQEGRRILAKSRLGGLPAVIKNPTFEHLLNANKKVVS